MVKIISLFIRFLNIITKLLYKFECFLLKFITNDSHLNPLTNAYRRFKVHSLPITEPILYLIFNQETTNHIIIDMKETLARLFMKNDYLKVFNSSPTKVNKIPF